MLSVSHSAIYHSNNSQIPPILRKLYKPLRIYNDNTLRYNIKITQLFNSGITVRNWCGNRTPDNNRYNALKNIHRRQNYVDGIIYMTVSEDGSALEIYDGMHRYSSLVQLYLSREEELSDHYIDLNIIPEYNYEYICDKICELNEGRPIPFINQNDEEEETTDEEEEATVIDLGFQQQQPTRSLASTISRQRQRPFRRLPTTNKVAINQLANKILAAFKTLSNANNMFTSSKNPQIPNTNNDIFAENIVNMIKKFNLANKPVAENINLLKFVNNYIKDNIYQKTETVLGRAKNKVEKNGWYLFIFKDWGTELVNIITHQPQLLNCC